MGPDSYAGCRCPIKVSPSRALSISAHQDGMVIRDPQGSMPDRQCNAGKRPFRERGIRIRTPHVPPSIPRDDKARKAGLSVNDGRIQGD